MPRIFALSLSVLTCLIHVGVQPTFAQNVLVELDDDGTLKIAEEFVGGNNAAFTIVFIEAFNDRVYVYESSVNGVGLDFAPGDVRQVEVVNVDWLVVSLIPQSLYADLSIQGAQIVEIEGIAGSGIFGNTTISTGLGTNVVSITDVELFGNLSISTGHATDLVQFGAPYGLASRWGDVMVDGNLSINTGQDNDELWFRADTVVGGDVEIQMGQGPDLLLGDERLSVGGTESISLGQQ